MNEVWAKSAAARRILAHWMDSRPAWLWSGDGARLLWRNPAAPMFGAKLKKSGPRLAGDAVPIKGQVSRLIRLGSAGRSSLSRIQFLAGGRPESTTCTVTPLETAEGDMALLIVGVDPIDAEVRAAIGSARDPIAEALLPRDADYLLIAADGDMAGGTSTALERFAPLLATGDLMLPEQSADAAIAGERLTLTRFKAGPGGEQLLLIESAGPAASIDAVRAEDGLNALEPDFSADAEEPQLPMDLEPAPPAPQVEAEREPEETPRQSLTSLFDRLADTQSLYGDLPPDDDLPAGDLPGDDMPPVPPVFPEEVVPEAAAPTAMDEREAPEAETRAQDVRPPEPDVIAAVIEFEDDLTDEVPRATTYRVTGRGFTPIEAELPGDIELPAVEPPDGFPAPVADLPLDEPLTPEIVERASRYNFDELSRILTDRVGNAGTELPEQPVEADPSAPAEGALVSIAGETFILNRLPIGLLVFRDQQVLFANRALTDLIGYDTIDRLRGAGIAAIFPSDDAAIAGPVTHLLRRDGAPIPVTARLQSITWQGRPALMLSASAADMRIGHEAAVRSFAEALAGLREDGFFEADRAGMIRAISALGQAAIGRRDDNITGAPLTALVHADDVPALRDFLERPARFAETARPSAKLKGAGPGTEILIFAEGQAGIVTGYFGYVRKTAAERPAQAGSADETDPSMLARISRGVRRPLNTIIGFADLLRSASLGTVETHRSLEYARDIKTAGQEIAVLVDELDEFARLRAGKYSPRPAELDLGALLESCMVRVRSQASAARVLVRSAISERLPQVRADRASMGQAVLNLLASAIDQSPAGGSVVLSAQFEEDGSVVINIRDSSAAGTDLGERFVVFRDGVSKEGEALAPVRSSVGLALTRSLVAVNGCKLSVDPAGPTGTLFSLTIPAHLVAQQQAI